MSLSFSIGSYLNAILLYLLLYKISKKIFDLRIVMAIIKMLVAGVVMAFAVRFALHYFFNIFDMQRFVGVFLQSLCSAAVGTIIYIGITYILKSEELVWAVKRRVNGANEEKK